MKQLTVSEIRHMLAAAEGRSLAALIRKYGDDTRAGVAEAVEVARRRLTRDKAETRRLDALYSIERALFEAGVGVVAGIDEVGRGALAGPVTAAAVVLPQGFCPRGLVDSKQLDRDARVRYDALIREAALALAVAHVPPRDIDALGIAEATAEAMRRALGGLGCDVGHVLIDGLPVALGCPSTAVVKGDVRVRSIAAASIVAKVSRDALMVEISERYEPYGFAQNKGYGSSLHLAALAELGPCELHRRSFAPCSQDHLF